MTYAPILVQVYTRKEHFIACIESLLKCKEAEHSTLFICSDAGRDTAAQEIVNQIRDYCTTIQGFKHVEVIAYESNLGANESGSRALNRIFEQHDRVIYSEDDNIFSSNFLEYINRGLDYYQDNDRVFSICGYRHPFPMPITYSADVFTSHLAAAWGQGLWRDKFTAIDFTPKGDYWLDRKKWPKILTISWSELMEHVLVDGARYGDVIIGYQCMMQNMVNIFPRVSLVRNCGNDGSGEHCMAQSQFDNQIIDDGTNQFHFIDNLTPNRQIERRQADAIDFPFVYGSKLRIARLKRIMRKSIRDYVVQKPHLKTLLQKMRHLISHMIKK